jgi:hypothetical protein
VHRWAKKRFSQTRWPRICEPSLSCAVYFSVADHSLDKRSNRATVSPTDNMMTPCTAKLTQAKKKHFNKYVFITLVFILPSLTGSDRIHRSGAIKALSFGGASMADEDEDDVLAAKDDA